MGSCAPLLDVLCAAVGPCGPLLAVLCAAVGTCAPLLAVLCAAFGASAPLLAVLCAAVGACAPLLFTPEPRPEPRQEPHPLWLFLLGPTALLSSTAAFYVKPVKILSMGLAIELFGNRAEDLHVQCTYT